MKKQRSLIFKNMLRMEMKQTHISTMIQITYKYVYLWKMTRGHATYKMKTVPIGW